ncbi:MAG: HigA family addiction module antitoxin [Candidatus Peregrinibacteria bacterium]|nr:HigA family addiction module antitoxin [Candidatus Peregrinibacteria bacterium]
MRPKKIPNIHPGEYLKEEFLIPLNISMYRLAKEINVSTIRISEIVRGKRSITADTAIRLEKYFGMSAEFWIKWQAHYDLAEAKDRKDTVGKEIKPYKAAKEKTYQSKIALHR